MKTVVFFQLGPPYRHCHQTRVDTTQDRGRHDTLRHMFVVKSANRVIVLARARGIHNHVHVLCAAKQLRYKLYIGEE